MTQNLLHIHKLGNFPDGFVHFLGGNAVIFQGEGNVLRYGQADKLAVGILQNRANGFRQRK